METWVIVKFLFTGIKYRNIIFLKSAFQYSIIPTFHARVKYLSLKTLLFSIDCRNSETFNYGAGSISSINTSELIEKLHCAK
jgi:hypothetical protein